MPALAYDITGNNTSAGIAIMGSGVGMFFLSPIGGVIADRLRKKPLVLVGQIIPSLVILAIGVLVVTDTITIVLLTLGTLIMGLGFAFMAPARQAWMAEMVPAALLPNAVALQQNRAHRRAGARPAGHRRVRRHTAGHRRDLPVHGRAVRAHPAADLAATQHRTRRRPRRPALGPRRAVGRRPLPLQRSPTAPALGLDRRGDRLRLRLPDAPARLPRRGARPRSHRHRPHLLGLRAVRADHQPVSPAHRGHLAGLAG